MDRRSLMVSAVAGAAVVLLAVAASSEPVDVWVAPPTAVTTPSAEAVPAAPPVVTTIASSGRDVWPAWLTTVMTVLSFVCIGLVALLVLVAGRAGPWATFKRVVMRLRRLRPETEPLPDVPAADSVIDIDAAAEHLHRGAPRNAIVACWMQLEADAGAAGFPRSGAETSAEYVARVVTTASIDSAPIESLAALYREARFSRHDLDERHRIKAVAALRDVKSALTHANLVST